MSNEAPVLEDVVTILDKFTNNGENLFQFLKRAHTWRDCNEFSLVKVLKAILKSNPDEDQRKVYMQLVSEVERGHEVEAELRQRMHTSLLMLENISRKSRQEILDLQLTIHELESQIKATAGEQVEFLGLDEHGQRTATDTNYRLDNGQ